MIFICNLIERNFKIILAALVFYHLVVSGLLVYTFKIIPHNFLWITDITILILFICALINRISAKNGTRFLVFPKIFYLVLLFFAWTTVTALVNSINVITFLLHFKDNIRFMILAFAIINLDLSFEDIQKTIWLILVILLLQVPVTTIQVIYLGMGDRIVGTLTAGGTSNMVLLCCVGVSLVISLYICSQRKLWLLISVPFFTLPIIFGNIHAGLFLLPYSLLCTFMKEFKNNVKSVLFIFGVIAVFITTLFFTVPIFRSTATRYVSLFGVAVQDQFLRIRRDNSPGRIQAPIIASEWLSEKDYGWLFGYGFGAMKKTYWHETSGEYAHKYAPITNQVASTLLETGFPGLLLLSSIFIALFVWGVKLVKRYEDFSKSIAITFTCAVSLMIIGFLYTNVMSSYYFGFLFWLLFGVLYIIYFKFSNGKKKQRGVV